MLAGPVGSVSPPAGFSRSRGRGLGSQPAEFGESVCLGVRERVLGMRERASIGIKPCGLRESGRVASGLSPRGVASFVHASPCPNGALWWLTPVGTQDLPWAFFSLGPFRAWTSGGRAVANAPCGYGFGWAGVWGLTAGPEAVPAVTPDPMPNVPEDRSAAGAVR